MDLRCDHKLHGKWDKSTHTIEFKCGSKLCGAGPGVVVLHRFDLTTGLIETVRYQDPEHLLLREETLNDPSN